jgi:hypothetical protein
MLDSRKLGESDPDAAESGVLQAVLQLFHVRVRSQKNPLRDLRMQGDDPVHAPSRDHADEAILERLGENPARHLAQ